MKLPLAAAVAAAAVIAGSLGPWAKIAFASANGTEGDGVITLIAGFVALGASAGTTKHVAWMFLSFLAFGLSFAVGVYHWHDIVAHTGVALGTTTIHAQAGWGVVLVTVASGCGLALSSVATTLAAGLAAGFSGIGLRVALFVMGVAVVGVVAGLLYLITA